MLHFTLKLAPDLIVRSLQCFGYKVDVFPKFMQGESTKKIWLFRGTIFNSINCSFDEKFDLFIEQYSSPGTSLLGSNRG